MKTPPPDPRIERARYGLILDAPFFGALMVRLPVVRDDSVETFCTNGQRIRYNQAFADGLSDGELRYILCHEIMHCAMGHLWRLEGRDLDEWNIACDYAVNQMLDDYAASAGGGPWSRPKGMLDIADEPTYRGLSPEEIYKLRRQKKQEQQPPPQQPGAPDPSAPPQPGDPNELSQPSQPGEKMKPQPGTPDPNGQGQPQPGPAGPGDFEPAPADEPKENPAPGEEGGLEDDWQIATVQAERLAMMKGNCPGGASNLVNELKKPKVDWRDTLREFIRQRAKCDYSFSRPNKRHLARGFLLPSLKSERMGRLVAAFDSSGSTVRFAADFATEVQAALDEVQPESLDLIICDAKVQKVQRFEPGDAVSIDAKGGGGTDFRPVFAIIDDPQNAAEHELEAFDEPPICVVYLTDLEGSFPPEPEYPVLWCVPKPCAGRRQPPFGEVITIG
jgi:predicted metal-dependent peptidase